MPHAPDGLLNSTARHNGSCRCGCELASWSDLFDDDGQKVDPLPEGFYPDNLHECYADVLVQATGNFKSYELKTGRTVVFADLETNGKRRFYSYQVWAELAMIYGIRVRPPPCVFKVVEAAFGPSETGFREEENKCNCKTCKLSVRQMAYETEADALLDSPPKVKKGRKA